MQFFWVFLWGCCGKVLCLFGFLVWFFSFLFFFFFFFLVLACTTKFLIYTFLSYSFISQTSMRISLTPGNIPFYAKVWLLVFCSFLWRSAVLSHYSHQINFRLNLFPWVFKFCSCSLNVSLYEWLFLPLSKPHSSVTWGCRIHWLHLCRGVRPP